MMLRKGIIYLAAIAALICAVDSCSTPAETSLPDCEITAQVDSLFPTIFTSPAEPGGVVMIYRNDTLVYNRSFGSADLQRNIPISDSTVFNISAATKTFSAVAIMKLQEKGLLSLDDSLSKFFPDFPSKIFDKITIRHILTHNTGLPDKRPRTADQWNEYVKEHPSSFGYGPDFMLYGREEELISFFRTLDNVNSEPGTKFEFQSAPFMLIPSIVEATTGTEYEKWMKANIFKPLGLKETHFYDPGHEHPRMAHAYCPAEGAVEPGHYRSGDNKWDELDYGETEFFLTRGDHGVCSTPREFGKWIHSLYNGEVISMESLKEITSPQTQTADPNYQYALGSYVRDIPEKPYKVFHSRNNGGFSIFDAVFPHDNIRYVIMSNRSDWVRRNAARQLDRILTQHEWLRLPESANK